MEINSDFRQRVVVHSEQLDWRASPLPGVHRRMLDRIGDEVARATSVVRYQPGSSFSAHTHGGGEEFLVLDGVFQDEHGDFPAGSYVRNPPTSRHTPRSDAGCTILVKLWQFDPADRLQVRVGPAQQRAEPDPSRPGVRVTPLHRDEREDVRIETWAPGAEVLIAAPDGAELFVLEGGFSDRGGDGGTDSAALTRHSWLRAPVGSVIDARAGVSGTKVWIKTGHLRFAGGQRPGPR